MAELIIKTKEFQDILNKAIKGMGNNKMVPITEMIGINAENDTISLLTTDGLNRLEVIGKLSAPTIETVSVSVQGNNFAKLIQKMTTENIKLDVVENKITVVGNGKYVFPLPVDEDDNIICMKSIKDEDKSSMDTTTVKSQLLKDVYEINKSAVAITMEQPQYVGYYFDSERSITTNSLKISSIEHGLVKNPMLLYSSFVSLFPLIDEDTVDIVHNDSSIYVIGKNILIKGLKMTELSLYPSTEIKTFLQTDLPHKVTISKQSLLNLLDRISLFVTPYDKNGIKLEFSKDGLNVWTVDGKNVELVPYVESNVTEPYKVMIDVTNLKMMLESNPDSNVVIYFGHPDIIKMCFGNVIQILALQQD